jgi:hypothetical protein
MGKKIRIFFVILIFLSVISYGLINLSSNLPKFIKDESRIKVNYGDKPYEITFDMGDYVIYTGSGAIANIKEGAGKGITKLTEKVKVTAYNLKENTSKGIERLLNANKYSESK